MRRDAFKAIADPTRREILHMLSSKSMNYNSLAGNFDMSRPAVAKHIKILSECGLIIIRQEGREKICIAQLRHLREVTNWIDQYRIFWNNKLDSLEKYLAKSAPSPSTHHKPSKKSKK
jgi:DNA-binding transcriptional ArsR family regulator